MPESSPHRIYLDNAATSWPKPGAVYEAMDDYNRRAGAAVGRGAYRRAVDVQRVVDRCRQRVADLFRAESPDRIVFTFNGTDGLNLALHGLLGEGDHVVTSVVEHNSVLRPLRELARRRGVETTHVPADATGRIYADDVRGALRPNTKLVAIVHASNVTGTIQPIADVAAIAREAGVLCLVDAAQSAGHLPIDLRELPVDLLACPGHKGLLGPLGTGVLYIRPGVEEQLHSTRQGGTGSNSEDDRQPAALPDKYESGNHNAPGLCGLEAALDWLQNAGVGDEKNTGLPPSHARLAIRDHERQLTARLLDGLAGIDALQTYGPRNVDERVGVVSLSLPGFEPQVLASILDESFGIETRAGLHCAPGVHRAIGTFDSGGTVRLSLSPFTTDDDIDAALAALRDVAGAV